MTILHAHSTPRFASHLRAVLAAAAANAHPHSVDIAVGYFYLSGFAPVSDLLATRAPTNSASSSAALTAPRWRKSPPACRRVRRWHCSPTAAYGTAAVLTPV